MSDFRKPWGVLWRCPVGNWSGTQGETPGRAEVVLKLWEGMGSSQGYV